MPNLISRDEHLNYLRQALLPSDWVQYSPVKRSIICGLQGVGKTELACQFANAELSRFSFVYWLNSETTESLMTSYRQLAEALRIYIENNESNEAIRKKIHSKLENADKPWLLVFDNVEEKLLLPQRSGSILITTLRSDLWKEDAHPVGPFSKQEGMALLEKTFPTSALKDRDSLLEDLEWFPLALGQAIGYIQEEGITLEQYLKKISKKGHLLGEGTARHARSLGASWGLTLQSLKEDYPTALAWLQCCAYLSPEKIPEHFLRKWLDPAPELRQKKRDILKVLGRYNLVYHDREQRTLSLHRLMQGVLRDQQIPAERIATLLKAMKLLKKCYVEDNPSLEEISSNCILLPHFKAIIETCDHLASIPDALKSSLTETLHLLGDQHLNQGSYQEGATILARALTLAEEAFGPGTPGKAKVLSTCGAARCHLAQYRDAIPLFQGALTIRERVYGKENSKVADSLGNLGSAYYDLGNYDEAISFHKRALGIREKVYGQDHPDVAHSLSELGDVHFSLEKCSEAISYHKRALAMRKKVYGQDHPDVALSLNNLGVIHNSLRKYSEAISHYKDALVIWEKVYGQNHPTVATSLGNLGSVHYNLRKHNEAISYHKRALTIRETVYGQEHPEVAESLGNLGSAHSCLREHHKALEHLERAYEILKKILGESHSSTQLCKRNLTAAHKNSARSCTIS